MLVPPQQPLVQARAFASGLVGMQWSNSPRTYDRVWQAILSALAARAPSGDHAGATCCPHDCAVRIYALDVGAGAHPLGQFDLHSVPPSCTAAFWSRSVVCFVSACYSYHFRLNPIFISL